MPFVGEVLAHLGIFVLLIIAVTEGWSIAENVSGAKRARKMLGYLKALLRLEGTAIDAILPDEEEEEDYTTLFKADAAFLEAREQTRRAIQEDESDSQNRLSFDTMKLYREWQASLKAYEQPQAKGGEGEK